MSEVQRYGMCTWRQVRSDEKATDQLRIKDEPGALMVHLRLSLVNLKTLCTCVMKGAVVYLNMERGFAFDSGSELRVCVGL